MALIDDNDELTPVNDISELDAEAQKQEAAAPAESPKIPDKYRGKSVEEIVEMHQQAERLIGRQAQEVGEVRRLADQLLRQQLSQKQPEPIKEENELDFFEDPKLAVKKAVESHPDVQAARMAAMQMQQLQAQAILVNKHPDYVDVVRNPEFIEWVKESPMRLNMYALADAQYDLNAADELLSTYKQLRGVKAQQVAETGKTVRNNNLKAAAVDTGGTGETSKKVYRRADLIRLRLENPDRYDALQDEIMKAYTEGRVR